MLCFAHMAHMRASEWPSASRATRSSVSRANETRSSLRRARGYKSHCTAKVTLQTKIYQAAVNTKLRVFNTKASEHFASTSSPSRSGASTARDRRVVCAVFIVCRIHVSSSKRRQRSPSRWTTTTFVRTLHPQEHPQNQYEEILVRAPQQPNASNSSRHVSPSAHASIYIEYKQSQHTPSHTRCIYIRIYTYRALESTHTNTQRHISRASSRSLEVHQSKIVNT